MSKDRNGLRVGDRVNVTAERTVTEKAQDAKVVWVSDDDSGIRIEDANGKREYVLYRSGGANDGTYSTGTFRNAPLVSVEKIEPPVEVFKAGDTVRSKGSPNFIFTVGRYGYLDHMNGIWNANPEQKFDSRYYEKVTLS